MRSDDHDHGDGESKDDGHFNRSQDHARFCRDPDPEVGQGEDEDNSQDGIDVPGDIDTRQGLNKAFGIGPPDDCHQREQERLGD